MKLLLDTHTVLWFYLADPQLSATANAAIMDPANESKAGSAQRTIYRMAPNLNALVVDG